MLNDIAFVTVAFGEKYIEEAKRLDESIKSIYPDALFVRWLDGSLPIMAKPFLESLYGFKVHAVDHLRNIGIKRVVWFDPACILMDKMDYYFDLIDQYGVIAVSDESKLANTCCDKAYKYFKVDIEGSRGEDQRLVGGSFYAFDFSLPLCNTIFDKWKKSELDGIFGSQEEQATEQINRHRNDESCMALSLYTSGSKPFPTDIARYCSSVDCIVDKKHFR